MKINCNILKKVEQYDAQLIAVTKYFDVKTTHQIYDQLKNKNCVLALGENRIDEIISKDLPRDFVHFIGNIQSRRIKKIVKHCSVIHSLQSFNHAELINKEIEQSGCSSIDVFLQVNISNEPQKSGIILNDISRLLDQIKSFSSLNIVGISAMGAGDFSIDQKRAEFRMLNKLRNQYLPQEKISAGTSRDFEIALKEGIDIVRVGQGLFG